MIGFAIPRDGTEFVFDVAILYDTTMSDDQKSLIDIQSAIFRSLPDNTGLGDIFEFNLSYDLTFTHNGENFGPGTMKQTFDIKVYNPDTVFRDLIKLQIPKDSITLQTLSDVTKLITDNKTQFPRVTIFVPNADGNDIIRTGIIYYNSYEPGEQFLDSLCELKGAHFDDAVTRLNFSFNITKDIPLYDQLKPFVNEAGFDMQWNFDFFFKTNSNRYYAPKPLARILADICLDNFLVFSIGQTSISFNKIDENNEIVIPNTTNIFCFNNLIPFSFLIDSQNFRINNYSNVEFRSEIVDLELFTSIFIGNDSRDPNAFDTFSKFNVMIGTTPLYRFYLLSYSITFSRKGKYMDVTGTNNWLLQNLKLDSFLENKIYTQTGL